MQARELRRQAAVDLFGKGVVGVVSSQARFQVHHGNPVVEGGQRCCEARRRVPLDEDRSGRSRSISGARPCSVRVVMSSSDWRLLMMSRSWSGVIPKRLFTWSSISRC